MVDRIQHLADELRSLTRLEIERLRDRFDVEELLEPDPEELRVEAAISAAEARLDRVEAKIREAHTRLNHVDDQIERKTEVLQALVRASTLSSTA